MSYAMKQRIAHINNKKMNGNDKSQLFNNKMFNRFIINMNDNNSKIKDSIKNLSDLNNNIDVRNNLILSLTSKIERNDKICSSARKINSIINDLHDVVENSSPVINTPEHPFTKMKIERYLMVGTSIKPYVYESLPTINIDNNTGIWTDRIDIGGFVDENITEIYNLVKNNNVCDVQENDDGTVEVNLYELTYEHLNGYVTFVRSMIINPKTNLMTLVKTWNVVLTC